MHCIKIFPVTSMLPNVTCAGIRGVCVPWCESYLSLREAVNDKRGCFSDKT